MKGHREKVSESGIRGSLAPTLEIPPRTEEHAAKSGPRRPDLMAEGRRRVLLHLADHGVATLGEMPRAWPVSQFVLRLAVAQLIARGAVEALPESEGLLRLTDLGRREAQGESSPVALPVRE